MAGKIHQMLQKIIVTRAHGNPALAQAITIKLLMKGIDCPKWDKNSADDPAVLDKVRQAASDLGVLV